jgi:dTDP-4-amino-4,6-dideoxygalactose transaminase
VTIPFLDLKAQYAAIETAVRAAIDGVFERGVFILGPEVAAFEQEFAAYLGAQYAIGVASGTDALHLALRACGSGPGDEVITVTNTAVATVAAVELAGACPVFVDIDPATFNLNPRLVDKAITPRTKALLPVHLYGQPADLQPLLDIARARGLRVIEDACQAHGATYQGKKVGTLGDIGCFSFYPTKNLGGYGDGGMVITNDAGLAERLKLLRAYGWKERDRSVLRGVNSRLDEVQAAVLRVKLRYLDAWNQQRRALAARYTEQLSGISSIILPHEAPYGCHVYHLYVVRAQDREGLRAYLAAQGIGTLIHYPLPIHCQEAYFGLGYAEGALPASERAAREIFSLPLYPLMEASQVDQVCQAIRTYYGA